MILPELLAPAGSFEAGMAAISAGADAVYVGGRLFNARMNAQNFTDGQLADFVRICHKRGVKLYVTVNTAIYDRELKEACDYLDLIYKMGVDALIISDLGLVSIIKDRYPDMELHASTQASGHNADCAEAFARLGISRMVCARELSESEIRRLCQDSPIEIEQFVHGAMCVCQSGQCLASHVMGGRSGNRGVCAQPCRMKYNGAYPLSLKDMSLATHITELISSGVRSLKIEGRMKSPAYVYQVVSVWRRLLDEARNAEKHEMETLASIFSRGGFTDGYYTERVDKAMLGVRSESDIQKTAETKTSFKDLGRSLPAITVNDRTPKGEIAYPKAPKKSSGGGKPIYTARFYDPRSVCGEEFFSHIYLPLDRYEKGVCDGVLLPPSVFGHERDKFLRDLERAVSLGATEAMVTHLGQIETVKRFGLTPHGDYRLNVFNTACASLYRSHGLCDVMLSPELTLPQIRDINAPKSVIVYGKIPIMLLTKPLEHDSLTDKTGATFKVIKENGRDILLNSVPVYMADKGKELDLYGARGRHFVFTDESRAKAQKIISAYQNGEPAGFPMRRISK